MKCKYPPPSPQKNLLSNCMRYGKVQNHKSTDTLAEYSDVELMYG